MKNAKVDATQGNILRLIVVYTVPLILMGLLQKLFHSVDIVVLGILADSVSVASVGATSTIIHLVIDSFFGLSGGVRILLARHIGAREEENARKTVETALLLSVILGILIAVVGVSLSSWFLELVRCPADCFDGALQYLRIYIFAAPVILLHNFGSSVLIATGDTARPMYYGMISGTLNLTMNVILCIVLEQKVMAVGIATVASQLVGAVLICNRLQRANGMERIELHKLRFHPRSFLQLLRYGAPLALANSLYPLANMQISTAVNSFDVPAVAGNSAAVTLEGILNAFTSPFATTTATFVGQNLGAKKPEQVKRSHLHCLWMDLAVGIILGVFFYSTGRCWLAIILGDDLVAIDYAMTRMKYTMLFYWLSAMVTFFSNTIQAFGYSVFSAIASVVCVFGFRSFWMTVIYPLTPTFSCLCLCFVMSWLLLVIVYIVFNSVIFVRYAKGKYRKL